MTTKLAHDSGLPSRCESRGVVCVKVDEASRTASVRWQDDLSLYSVWGGSIATPYGDVEFALSNPFPGLGSRIREVNQQTNQAVWQMDVQDQVAYRDVGFQASIRGAVAKAPA